MDVPGTAQVRVRPGVVYLRDARDTLTLDLYLPAGLKRGERRPAVVFLNAIGDAPGIDPLKDWEIYRTWPRLLAAHGMIGVTMETAPGRVPECLRAVFAHLAEHGAGLGIDGARLGCYAASANVTQAAEYLLGDSAHPGIRAAVLYYGRPPERAPRPGLPVLFVVAESDVPGMAAPLAGLWQRVIDAKAPWELVHGSGLPHAFDALANDEDSRRMVRRTIDFWRAHLEAAPAASAAPSEGREVVEALYWNDPARAIPVLERWIASHPDDAAAWAHKGRMHASARQFADAAAAYEKAGALGASDPGFFQGLAQVRIGQQRWADAAQLLERAIAAGARSSQTLGSLGWTQLHLGRNEDAVRSYEQAVALGIPPGPLTRGAAHYNLACGYARLGRTDQALDALAIAVESGFGNRAGYEADADLTPLRGHARWQELLGRLPAAAPAAPD